MIGSGSLKPLAMKDSKRNRLRIVIYNRRSKALEEEEVFERRLANLFYGTYLGRCFSTLFLTRRPCSNLYGRLQNHPVSSRKIDGFIEKCGIDADEIDVPPGGYRSFNDFFTRKLKAERRPIHQDPGVLISPADSRLLAYPIQDSFVYPVKGVPFSIEELIGDRSDASTYDGGLCLVFRLAPSDYHRFCYIDDGEHGPVNSIGGNLHSVNPIAIRSDLKIFQKNYREYCIMKTKNFDDVIQIEVGALLVGKIHQNLRGGGRFLRGLEKGYFEFGASTIVTVFKPSIVTIDEDVAKYSGRGIETLVQYGSAIGVRSLRPA
jgi:phosphatidylserine decarboxylase